MGGEWKGAASPSVKYRIKQDGGRVPGSSRPRVRRPPGTQRRALPAGRSMPRGRDLQATNPTAPLRSEVFRPGPPGARRPVSCWYCSATLTPGKDDGIVVVMIIGPALA